MRIGIIMLLSSLALIACGGAATEEAKAPEKDPWAGYTGKYTAAPDGRTPPEETGKSDAPTSKKAEAKKADAKKTEAKESEPAPAPSSGKSKTSKSTILGESISLISPNELESASKSAFKSKIVSSKVMVGAQYEQVQVQLKGGAVQIIRPAQSPNPHGPAITAPKARNGALTTTESGWYDEEADVLVIVNAGKKAGAQKALDSMLKH